MAYSERMRFAFLIYLFASVTSLHAEKPFDFASTPGKLPKQVRPTEYAIWVKPDLKKLAFAGRETVKLNVAEPTRELILNALDLTITDAEIDGKTVPKTAIKFDVKNEPPTIATPEELTPGEHTLAIRFTGNINQFGRGLFYAQYQEQGTGAKNMFLGTQFEATAQILHYYSEYFGISYPLPKLDQLAIPGGFGGAMENWGGITYYETALLFDPANASAATKQRVYEVIAHEVAHQWFGDLVTMAWWDNLWLNEGFASWMGTKCTARFNPQWEVWLEKNLPRDPTRRTGIVKEQAMEGDARATTHPIQQKVETEAEANNAFDDITYKKGQSFLRMLESFLGEEAFRDGIRRYIEAHKYSNSTT